MWKWSVLAAEIFKITSYSLVWRYDGHSKWQLVSLLQSKFANFTPIDAHGKSREHFVFLFFFDRMYRNSGPSTISFLANRGVYLQPEASLLNLCISSSKHLTINHSLNNCELLNAKNQLFFARKNVKFLPKSKKASKEQTKNEWCRVMKKNYSNNFIMRISQWNLIHQLSHQRFKEPLISNTDQSKCLISAMLGSSNNQQRTDDTQQNLVILSLHGMNLRNFISFHHFHEQ